MINVAQAVIEGRELSEPPLREAPTAWPPRCSRDRSTAQGRAPKTEQRPDCKLCMRYGHLPPLEKGERYAEADYRPGPRSMGRWSELERRFD